MIQIVRHAFFACILVGVGVGAASLPCVAQESTSTEQPPTAEPAGDGESPITGEVSEASEGASNEGASNEGETKAGEASDGEPSDAEPSDAELNTEQSDPETGQSPSRTNDDGKPSQPEAATSQSDNMASSAPEGDAAEDSMDESVSETPSPEPTPSPSAPAPPLVRDNPLAVLPDQLPDGTRLRPIALFHSQLTELVPENFQPISILRLKDAIDLATSMVPDENASRVRHALYVIELVDDTLISERSVLDIQCDTKDTVHRNLGKVNLAINSSSRGGNLVNSPSIPRLESLADGNLVAVVNGDTSLAFAWTLKSETPGLVKQFDLRLPPSPQTRIVLQVPKGISVESLDGVVRLSPSPPPELEVRALGVDARYYLIDAGGLSRVRLKTTREGSRDDPHELLVRNQYTQYSIDATRVVWSHQAILQLQVPDRLPSMVIGNSTITSIEVNAIDTPFNSTLIGDGVYRIDINVPTGSLPQSDSPTSLTIKGQAVWRDADGWCDLPQPQFLVGGLVVSEVTSKVELKTTDPLRVIEWKLPDGWAMSRETTESEETKQISASGPPVTLDDSVISHYSSVNATDAGGSSEQTQPSSDRDPAATTDIKPPVWSRVRIARESPLRDASTVINLSLADGIITATSQLRVRLDPRRVEPIKIELQRGWTLQSINLLVSGRVIETPSINPTTSQFTIWPEATDVSDSELVIQAVGQSRIIQADPQIIVPQSWFLRFVDVQGEFLAAVTPPGNLDWSSQMSLLSQRIKRADIAERFQEFFASATKNAMFLRCVTGRTPALVLQPPSVAFDVATTLVYRLVGEEVFEDLIIEMSATSPSPQTITAQTGPDLDRPAFTWSLRQSDGRAAVSLPVSNVSLDKPDSDGVYTIDVSQWNLRGQRLVGRRHYSIQNDLSVRLPVVPNATSQTAEVLIGEGLSVKHGHDSVLRVSVDANVRLAELLEGRRDNDAAVTPPSDASGAAKTDSPAGDPASRSSTQADFVKTKLRYDAVDQPSLVITKNAANPNVNIVWDQEVTLVASSHGTDRIEAMLDVTASKPLEIDYDHDLRLISVEQDGTLLDSIDLHRRPLLIGATKPIKKQRIRLVWSRQQFHRNWWRDCTIPLIELSGVVMRSHYQVRASSDSFLPGILWASSPTTATRWTLPIQPGGNVLLVRRNNALAFGWLTAILVFALCWWIARRSLYLCAMIVILLATLASVWWPWHSITIGWFLVPSLMGALLVSTLRWKDRVEQRGERLRSQHEADSQAEMAAEDSTEFSVSTPVGGMILFAFLSLSVTTTSAQEAASPPQDAKPAPPPAAVERPTPAVDLLVPVDIDGHVVGDKLYIPRELKSSLLAMSSRLAPEEARFQIANYRLRIESSEESLRPGVLLLDADYIIHTDRPTDRVRLPFTPAVIRRIELVQDDQDRIVQFVANSTTDVIANVPLGDRFRMRVTLIPELVIAENFDNKGQLNIQLPPIAASRLTVEGSGKLERVRIGGVTGQVVSQRQLQIWTADIGPIKKLAIEFEFNKGNAATPTTSQPLRRRYWLHAGKLQTIVECQVEPAYPVSSGDTVSLLLRDSLLPTVVSSSWEIRQTDLLSPTRRQVTLAALLDAPGPIQLLWTLPSRVSNANAVEDAIAMVIPDVAPTAAGDSEPAWVGINSDPGIRVQPITREPLDALTDDQFLAVWSGYRGNKPDRTFVAFGQLPSFQLVQIPDPPPTIAQTHQVHIAVDALEIRYRAEITNHGKRPRRWILKLPTGVSLRQLLVDGQPLQSRPLVSKNFTEVMLGDLSDPATTVVEAIAVSNLPSNGKFTLPRLTLNPSSATTDRYFVTRDQSLDVRFASQAPQEFTERVTVGDLDHLAKGWVPIVGYQFDSSIVGDAMQLPKLVLRSSLRPTRFDANQLIALSWSDGRWTMQSLTRFAPGKLPDFIDIQVPTRWCESLEVSSAVRWSRQPANDVSTQLIRVSCDEQVRVSRVISISGTLASADKSRVSVPSIQILGEGRRSVHVSVPSRLTNEPIRWRSSSVRAAELPAFWSTVTPSTNLDLLSPRATYAVAASGWSIELAPLQQQNRTAIVLAAETRVFPGHERIVVMSRFDLIPGALDDVELALPQDATCLGAWTANQAVNPMTVGAQETSQATPDNPSANNVVRLPLSLSRLAQSVEVLFELPLSRAHRGDYAARMLAIPVSEAWVSTYALSDSPDTSDPSTPAGGKNKPIGNASDPHWTRDEKRTQMIQRRGLSLAASIVQMINDSSDILAERPTAESTTWIRPMIARYEDLAAEAGHPVQWGVASQAAIPPNPASESNSDAPRPSGPQPPIVGTEASPRSVVSNPPSLETLSWEQLNAKMEVHVKRYSSPSDDVAFLFSNRANLKGYKVQQIEQIDSQLDLASITLDAPTDTDLRTIITNSISLLCGMAVIVLLWPLRRYFDAMTSHPAFWLALVAICGFFVAPIPVAASLLLVAISLPAFPSDGFKRHRSR